MRRHFCVLPSGFSEAQSLDCARGHRHFNRREIEEGEASGDITFFDLHPVTKRARYTVKKFSPSPSAIPSGLMERAAGASFREASDGNRRASNHVGDYGRVEDLERAAHHREWVELHGVTYDDSDVWFGTPKPGKPVAFILNPDEPDPTKRILAERIEFDADAAPTPRRTPVRVSFHLREPLCWERAADFYTRRWPTEPRTFPLAMLKEVHRDFQAALDRLNDVWPRIVYRFDAGCWGEMLNKMSAGKLPSPLLQKLLQVYLHSP